MAVFYEECEEGPDGVNQEQDDRSRANGEEHNAAEHDWRSGGRVVGGSRSAQRLEVEEEEAELVAVAVAAVGKRYVSLSPNLPAHEALCFRADGNRGNRVAELPVETG